MSGLTLLLFLCLFYFLPAGAPLYEQVWNYALKNLPYLVLRHSGHLVCNVGFYLLMGGCWLGCWAFSALLVYLGKKDDPRWKGIFAGITSKRGLVPADFALTVLFVFAITWCVVSGHPVHGVLSAGSAVLGTLLIAPALAGARPHKKQKPSAQQDAHAPGNQGAQTEQAKMEEVGGKQTEAGDKVSKFLKDPRALQEHEPPDIDQDQLSERALQEVEFGAASGLVFVQYMLNPPESPDSNIPDEQPYQIGFHISQTTYMAESARERPEEPGDLAEALSARAHLPVLQHVTDLMRLKDGNREKRYRVRKALEFVERLGNKPTGDGHTRFPIEVLHDKEATANEKAWLVATLLCAAGFRTALWQPTDQASTRYGVAVADVYDGQNYVPATSLVENRDKTRWLFCHSEGLVAQAGKVALYPLRGATVAAPRSASRAS